MIVMFLLITGYALIDTVKSMIELYQMDEDEIIARQDLKEKRAKKAEMIIEDRKESRRIKYEEAAIKEAESISELERRRQLRQEHEANILPTLDANVFGDNEGFVTDDNANTPDLSSKVLGDGPGSGFVDTGTSTTAYNNSNKTKQTNTNITKSDNGELHITGSYNDKIDAAAINNAKSNSKAATDLLIEAARNAKPRENQSVDEMFFDADLIDSTVTNKVVNTIEAEFKEEKAFSNDAIDEVVEETIDEPVREPKKRERKHTKASKASQEEAVKETTKDVAKAASASSNNAKENQYQRPPIELLGKGKPAKGNTKGELQATAKRLEETLDSFGVHVTVTDVACGPAVTRYEMQLDQGTRVNKITGLADDIKLAMAVQDVRIEAPIPGKSAVGIEMPNKEAAAVAFRDLLEESDFLEEKGDLLFAVGKDISGKVIISDIGKMPHVLIAGATGSGKSVCINTLIMSIIYKADPSDVKLIMIDPKVVELSVYNGIPHLLIPVVTDPKKAAGALGWAVNEMDARYKKFAKLGVRGLEGYNQKVIDMHKKGEDPENEYQKMPKIVVIVDELADLMMVAKGEVEDAIVRLTQLARAAGIHLVIATQRPSVDVITGLIKANVPSRIAFAVSSGVDSRTIIDTVGAEKLLGKGDMLFLPRDLPKPIRVQGAFVSDREVSTVVECLKAQEIVNNYDDSIVKEITMGTQNVREANKEMDRDEYFVDAGKFIIEKQKASIGMLQRMYKIGFNRAARIMDQLCDAGVVGPEEGTKARTILMTMEEFDAYLDSLMNEE
ncbi:MAG: DNA translocase FtsK [Lachnospiraceae bacterium]|nr:DNA translocase FtsK [Lachnospiraceae bacterium]